MMESSCNKKNEIHYNEPNSLPNKQQDNLSDTPSITGLVDTGSPCGTVTTEENSPVTTRELPPPPSPASTDKKALNAKEASILKSNRSSEVYDQPETNITAVTSKVSVEYAEPEVIHRREAKVENEYDDPEDFYYYNLPNGQMVSAFMWLTVPLLTIPLHECMCVCTYYMQACSMLCTYCIHAGTYVCTVLRAHMYVHVTYIFTVFS